MTKYLRKLWQNFGECDYFPYDPDLGINFVPNIDLDPDPDPDLADLWSGYRMNMMGLPVEFITQIRVQ